MRRKEINGIRFNFIQHHIRHEMCQYYLVESLCGHQILMAGPSCYLIYAQLQRINDPAELARSARNNYLPFDMPDQCHPGRWNVHRVIGDDYCCTECKNNGIFVRHDQRIGNVGARYGPGSERIGVGWRY